MSQDELCTQDSFRFDPSLVDGLESIDQSESKAETSEEEEEVQPRVTKKRQGKQTNPPRKKKKLRSATRKSDNAVMNLECKFRDHIPNLENELGLIDHHHYYKTLVLTHTRGASVETIQMGQLIYAWMFGDAPLTVQYFYTVNECRTYSKLPPGRHQKRYICVRIGETNHPRQSGSVNPHPKKLKPEEEAVIVPADLTEIVPRGDHDFAEESAACEARFHSLRQQQLDERSAKNPKVSHHKFIKSSQ
jgi:hypothetical protein